MQQMAPGSPVRVIEQEQYGGPQRARDARTQSDAQRDPGNSARPDVIEHSRGVGQRDPTEAWCECGRVCQGVDLPSPSAKLVGNT
jgi:hypothetical protein